MNLLDVTQRDALVSRLNLLTPDAKGQWGKLNAHQMLCHVADGFRASLGEFSPDPNAKNSLLGRTVMKWAVLYVIPIPQDVPTARRSNPLEDGTQPTEFEADRQTLLGYIEKFATQPAKTAWGSHFRFGAMNQREWAILAAKHLDHHLRQFGV